MSKKLFFKAFSYSLTKQLAVLLTSVISLPLLLSYFGPVNYGIWILILGLTGYIHTVSFGIPSAMTTLVANTVDLKDKSQILKKSFYLLSFICTIFIIIFLCFISMGDNWIITLLGNINEEHAQLAKSIFIYFVIFTLVKLPFDLFIQFFTGMNAVHNSQIYGIVKALAGFIVVILTVQLDLGITMFVIAWLACDLLISFLSIFHVLVKYAYLGKETVGDIEVSSKAILKSGFAFFQVGLAASFVWSIDNLVISHFLSPEFVTPYSIAFKMFSSFFIFSSILNGVLAPMYGNAYAVKDFERIRKLTNMAFKLLPLFGATVWFLFILFSKEIIILWTGNDDFFGGYLLFFSLGMYGYVLSYVNTFATLLYSLNFANRVYLFAWGEAILNLILSLLFIQIFGIGGVALGTAISALFVSFILPRVITKLMCNEITYDFNYSFKQFFILIFPTLIVCIVIKDTLLIYKMIFFIIALLILFFVSWKFLDASEKKWILLAVKKQ